MNACPCPLPNARKVPSVLSRLFLQTLAPYYYYNNAKIVKKRRTGVVVVQINGKSSYFQISRRKLGNTFVWNKCFPCFLLTKLVFENFMFIINKLNIFHNRCRIYHKQQNKATDNISIIRVA